MNRTSKGLLLLVAVAVLGVGVLFYARSGQKQDVVSTTQSTPAATSASDSSANLPKSETEKRFEGFVGDDYDRMFLANMIAHHQGAVDMAKLAQTNAKHVELKQMANDIIATQTNEINNMLQWQKDWGYPATSGEAMVDHSAMSMEMDMEDMTKALQGKAGDDFDKAFISSMIQHHESALAMARPGLKNASHQQVKDTVKAIIDAQTQEITQMKQWQKDRGFGS